MKRRIFGGFALALALAALCWLMPCAAMAAEYPESEHPYANSENQEWTYTHPTAASSLTITFSSDTEVESNYDFIYIIDSEGNETKYTGTTLAGQSITLPGNSFTIRLTSDKSVQKQGFTITDITAESITPEFTISSGVLTACTNAVGDIVIPDGVTKIGDSVFEDNTEITSVVIPEGVTAIGNAAFSYCDNLTHITLPSTLKTIGNRAFTWCEALSSIILPDNITSIGTNAFYAVRTLACTPGSRTASTLDAAGISYSRYSSSTGYAYTLNGDGSCTITGYTGKAASVTLPSEIDGPVTAIDDRVFYLNKTVSSIVVPEGVTSIGDSAFCLCDNLTSVTLPNSVTALGTFVFAHNKKLTNITLSDLLTEIPQNAFFGCELLSTITLPQSVTSIGDYAFYLCTNLYINLPYRIAHIGTDALYNIRQLNATLGTLTQVTLDKQGISYGRTNPFYYTDHGDGTCTISGYWGSYTDPIIPEDIFGMTVIGIGYEAFENNTALTSVTLPDTLTAIDRYAFNGCTSLASIDFAGASPVVSDYSFYNCRALTNVYADSLTSWTSSSFTSYYGTPMAYAKNLSIGSKQITGALVIPEGITSIGSCAFYKCTGITSVTLPASLTSVGNYAFDYCNALTAVYAPSLEHWLSISFGAYSSSPMEYAKTLYVNGQILSGDLVIPSGVTAISAAAFKNCSGITSVTIPVSVTAIGRSAFSGCTALTDVYGASLASWMNIDFDSADANPMYSAQNLYLNGQLITELVIPSGTTQIGDYAFAGCSGFTRITLPSGLNTLRYGAFQNCTGITSITLPASLTTINSAFYGCKNLADVYAPSLESWLSISHSSSYSHIMYEAENLYLGGELVTDLVIPDGVTSIGDYAFCGVDSLTSVTLPDSLTTLGGSAFYDCINMTSITLPSGLTEIDIYTFYNCRSLTDITLPQTLKTIDSNAFSSCKSLTSISLPNTLTSLEALAFEDCTSLQSITLSSSLTSICYGTFIECSSLKSIILPEGITAIEFDAFMGCKSLTHVFLPASLATIGNCAFLGCSNLTHIVLPRNLSYIDPYAFFDCSNLTAWVEENSYAHTFCVDNSIPFAFIGSAEPSDAALHLPTDLKTISPEAFINLTITEVVIPDGCKTLDTRAFAGCANLKLAFIPASVTEIADDAFDGCTLLAIVSPADSAAADYAAAHGLAWIPE